MSGTDVKKESCIICHKPLNIAVDTPINMRANYLCGCGQLCEKCFYEITSDKNDDELSPGQMAYIFGAVPKNGVNYTPTIFQAVTDQKNFYSLKKFFGQML